jgi:hypothetical protein
LIRHVGDGDAARAGDLLGRDAGLARALDRRSRRRFELSATFAVGFAAVLGAVGEAAWAGPLLVACVPVLVVVVLRLLSVEARVRSEVLATIAAGQAHLPLRVVRDEVRRLGSSDTRAALARVFAAPGRPLGPDGRVPDRACVVADPGTLEPVRRELDRVSAIIASGRASVEGLAAAAWMVRGPSALFDGDTEQLRRELNRVAFLLQSPPAR